MAYAFRLIDSLRSSRGHMIMSGLPNGNLEITSELVQPNRLHYKIGSKELILIGPTAYSRDNEGPWKKGGPINIPGLPIKQEDIFQMKSEPFIRRILNNPKLAFKGKISGEETIDGYKAIIYEITGTARGNSRAEIFSMRTWIATEDGFPRKLEMVNPVTGFKGTIRYFDFNANITINPPI